MKSYDFKDFKINRNLKVFCHTENTSYGFRHLAVLQRNPWETIATAKRCYYNRTWESYTYESVLESLFGEAKTSLTASEYRAFKKCIKNGGEHETDNLKLIAGIAKLGEIFGSTVKEKNDWKERMIKAGLENKGLIMPEDWDSLDEAEKQKRLDGAIGALA